MPKFDVQMCYEKWEYYRIEVEARDENAAMNKAQELWDKSRGGDTAFRYEEGEDDGNGAIITDCTEIKDAAGTD